jgi:hypothetical protein
MSSSENVRASGSESGVQSSYDYRNGEPAFIIADVTTDDAWLSVPAGQETDLSEWR